MLLDKELMLSDAQALAGTGNLLSSNTIDRGAAQTTPTGYVAGGDLGQGRIAPFFAQIVTAAAAGGTSVEFQLIQADDAALTTNVDVLATSGAIPTATLTLGYRVSLVTPRGTTKRYIGMRYLRTGTFTGTTGVSAGFSMDR